MTPVVTPEQVRTWRDQLASGAATAGSKELAELIAALEDLKTTASGIQARTAVAFDAARRAEQAAADVPARRQGRGVATELGLARRESTHRGQTLLGLAKVLDQEMPHTLDRMCDGTLSEFRATLLARETACLSADQRALVDEELCADPAALDGVGTRELVGKAKRLAATLDPAAVAERARKAAADRNVTVRPAPDTMAYLTGLLPVAQAVAIHAALTHEAEAARAAGDSRSMGQLRADLMLARITGLADSGDTDTAPAVPVTVNITIPDTSLAGGHEPATVSGDGLADEVIPAEVARHLIGQALDADLVTWFRQLYRTRLGRLVSMTSRQRTFPAAMAAFLSQQGLGICATPYCDAPVRHIDHIRPVDRGGTTSADNGQGLCEACNHAKQAPGWEQRPVNHPTERVQVETITPTGHRYTATAPAPPGWREPVFHKVGEGRYQYVA